MMPLICEQAHEEPFSRKPPTFEETQPKKKKNHAGCFFACYLLRSGTLSRQETETAISDQTGFYSNPPVSRTIWKLIWRRKQSQTAKQLSVITV